MTYCLDVEMFINEVEKFPEIWDLNSEDNRYKNRKQRAWSQIAQVFIADFDQMQENERLEVYKKLHSKWRNIRDSYVRDLKRNDGKKGYMYAKHLAFLDNLYKSNGQPGSEEDSRDWNDEETLKHKRLAGKRRRFEILSESNWPSDSEDVPSTIDNLKRRRVKENKTENIEFVDAPYPDPSCSYAVEDEDKSFFESLLPAVREFNVDQKLEFRSEVIRLLKDLRKNDRKFKLDPS